MADGNECILEKWPRHASFIFNNMLDSLSYTSVTSKVLPYRTWKEQNPLIDRSPSSHLLSRYVWPANCMHWNLPWFIYTHISQIRVNWGGQWLWPAWWESTKDLLTSAYRPELDPPGPAWDSLFGIAGMIDTTATTRRPDTGPVASQPDTYCIGGHLRLRQPLGVTAVLLVTKPHQSCHQFQGRRWAAAWVLSPLGLDSWIAVKIIHIRL